jgi:hypothetical protein
MFATIRRYTVAPGAIRQMVPQVEMEFLPRIRAIAGFHGYEMMEGGQENGRDVLATISLFDTREGAEESGRVAASWVSDRLADVDIRPVSVTTGEVLLSTEITAAQKASYSR